MMSLFTILLAFFLIVVVGGVVLSIIGTVVLPFIFVAIAVGIVLSIIGIIFKIVFALPMLIIILILGAVYYSNPKNKR